MAAFHMKIFGGQIWLPVLKLRNISRRSEIVRLRPHGKKQSELHSYPDCKKTLAAGQEHLTGEQNKGLGCNLELRPTTESSEERRHTNIPQ